jgi:hypothetical protein
MAVRYYYNEQKREAIYRTISEHQPVSTLRLADLLAPTYTFDAIKRELLRLFREGLVTKQRASKYEDPRLAGGTGFYYSISKPEEVQQ